MSAFFQSHDCRFPVFPLLCGTTHRMFFCIVCSLYLFIISLLYFSVNSLVLFSIAKHWFYKQIMPVWMCQNFILGKSKFIPLRWICYHCLLSSICYFWGFSQAKGPFLLCILQIYNNILFLLKTIYCPDRQRTRQKQKTYKEVKKNGKKMPSVVVLAIYIV